MFRRPIKKRAQSTAEYAIIIAIVVGAVVAMQVYVKRGIQGRIRDVVDFKGSDNEVSVFKTKQYEPYYSKSNMESTRDSKMQDSMTAGGAVTKQIVGEEKSTRTGTQEVLSTKNAD